MHLLALRRCCRVLFTIILLYVTSLCEASQILLPSPGPSRRRRSLWGTTSINFRGGSLQSRRWERMDGKALGGFDSSSSSLQSSLQSVSGGRACNVYIWDAPSALLHKWCHHLLKDCVYEGLGGRKFVRIEPGSILQLLYPCSRYSPDRCVACGGTFRDHLTLWWAKQLYTPFDRSMDNTFASASVLEPKFPSLVRTPKQQSRGGSPRARTNTRRRNSSSRRRNTLSSRRKSEPMETIRLFAFHRRYVTDLATVEAGLTGTPQERMKKADKEMAKVGARMGWRMERHELTMMDKKMIYFVPASIPVTEQPKRKQSTTLLFTRRVVLDALHRLISLQEMENDNIRLKERADGCC